MDDHYAQIDQRPITRIVLNVGYAHRAHKFILSLSIDVTIGIERPRSKECQGYIAGGKV